MVLTNALRFAALKLKCLFHFNQLTNKNVIQVLRITAEAIYFLLVTKLCCVYYQARHRMKYLLTFKTAIMTTLKPITEVIIFGNWKKQLYFHPLGYTSLQLFIMKIIIFQKQNYPPILLRLIPSISVYYWQCVISLLSACNISLIRISVAYQDH